MPSLSLTERQAPGHAPKGTLTSDNKGNVRSVSMSDRRIAEHWETGTKICTVKDVIFADLGNEISLLNNKSGIYYTLNSVGANVWRQLAQPKTLAEIKQKLLDDY